MKDYCKRFTEKHGERLFYMLVATIFASTFLFIDGMKESGTTILIAIATLAINKARSPQQETKEDK